MSHFTLGLITKNKPQKSDIEELLEPFSAHREVKTITPKEDVIKNAREWLKEYQDSDLYQEYLEDPEKYKVDANAGHIEYIEETFPKLLNMSDDDLFLYEIRYNYPEDITDDSGVISYYNPKAKWDWWAVGGRWEDYIRTTDGDQVNTAKIDNMVIDGFHEDLNMFYDLWDHVVEGKDVEVQTIFPPTEEFLLETFKTKENYAQTQSKFRTYALLLPTGDWVEPGAMGPFGLTNYSADSKKEYIKQYYKILKEYNDHYFTLIDCHI